jgi:Flp pilus assembly protein TadD
MLVETKRQKEANMIVGMRRSGLVILAVIALIAVAGFAAGCGGDDTTSTTAADSTATTLADGTTDSTMVVGGKTLDEYKAEIPDLEKAVEADPTDRGSLESLAVAHYQLGEYEEAEAAYLKILAIGEDAFTRNNLGNVYRDSGRTEEAKAAYRKAIETDPTLKYPYVNLSGVLKTEGDLAGAMEVLTNGAKYMNDADKSTLEAAEKALTSTTTT